MELTTDPLAADLAGRVLGGGEDARAALEEAIALAGLGIIDRDGAELVAPAEPSQGLSFRLYEVERMAELQAIGFAQPTTDLADVVAAPLAELDGEPVASMLIDGIRTGAADEAPTRRFWAHFLVELGRQSRDGYDLLGDIGAQEVSFDGVQTLFVLRRLQGDLLRVGGTAGLSLAAYRPTALRGATSSGKDVLVAGRSTPCSFEDIDYNDPRAGDLMFDRILARFPTGNAPRWRGAASIIQAYAELLMSLEPSMENDLAGPEPFERTRTTEAGDIQELRTTVIWSLLPERDVVDCMQAAINFMTNSSSIGLELAGSVPEADVVYIVNADDPIGLVDPKTPAPEHWLASTVTDQDGVGTVWVVGRPQESDLPEDARQVVVEQEIEVRVSVEGADVWRGLPESVQVPAGGPQDPRPLPPQVLREIRFSLKSILVFGVADWKAGGFDVRIEFDGSGSELPTVGYTIVGRLEPAEGDTQFEGPATIEGTYWRNSFEENCFSDQVSGNLLLLGDIVDGELVLAVTVTEDATLEDLEGLPPLFDILLIFMLPPEGGTIEERTEGETPGEGVGIYSCVSLADTVYQVTVTPDPR